MSDGEIPTFDRRRLSVDRMPIEYLEMTTVLINRDGFRILLEDHPFMPCRAADKLRNMAALPTR